jgi:hypothetical protein
VSKHYSTMSFLRQAPNRLLERYFTARGLAADVDWKQLRESDIRPIFNVLESQPEKERKAIETDFRHILSMADEGGTVALIDEGKKQDPPLDLANEFGEMGGHIERAFEVFLNHPQVFEVAQRIDYANGLTFSKRKGLPELLEEPNEDIKKAFEQTLSAYYRQNEGRGHGCQIDHYKRGDRHYWFAFLADYPQSRHIYDDENKLNIQSQRPAFELVFVYHMAEQSLEINGAGGKRRLSDLQRIFGRAILNVDLAETTDREIIYDLNGLLDRDFAFDTDVEDGIEKVRLKKLKFNIIGREDTVITLESRPSITGQGIHDIIDILLKEMNIPKSLLCVVQAGIQIVFRPLESKRKKMVSFTVSRPDTCSLKCEPKHETAKSYLKRWKLDVTGSPDYTPPVPRSDAQYILYSRDH